ncbi:MAG: hypothetical protein DBX97_24640 [Collinsella tanakaei]|nr:MAG: hypothetical protein DBX97_24640 [Collinsella tanakaei]
MTEIEEIHVERQTTLAHRPRASQDVVLAREGRIFFLLDMGASPFPRSWRPPFGRPPHGIMRRYHASRLVAQFAPTVDTRDS